MKNLAAELAEIGRILAGYRNKLEADGVPPNEAWALVQAMEERLGAPLLEAAEKDEGMPLEVYSALMASIVTLQLTLGQDVNAHDAVRYMESHGVPIRRVTVEEAVTLAEKAGAGRIQSSAIAAAFALRAP